jgi:competence protein ComEC
MGALARVEMALEGQRGALFPWVPVCLALGIGLYFGLSFEPSMTLFPYLGFALLGLALCALWWRSGWAPVIWAVVLAGLGFGLAATRAHLVDRPVIGWRYYGPVEGRVIGIDRSSSGAMRVLLDQVVLHRVDPMKTPERVRVSLHGQGGARLVAGARVIVTAHLSPPGGPVEPGGFDFQRHAWFLKLGAVGYARTPLLILAPPEGGFSLLRARLDLSARVQAALSGEPGAFAAAIMSGDRSGIGQDTLKALRVTNLAHLLAISGLHMGLLTGFVFAAFRLGLNLWPTIGLRLPVKKLAAVLALMVAAGYLGLSGGNIATKRAFVMVAVALLAVVLDRRVISLRSVALAASIVLVLWPEALLGPGFQMSFAATTALVVVFRFLRDAEISLGPNWVRPIAATVISSAVAGLATAPVAAAHFNQFAHYGLIANLLAVPLMGLLVIPAGVVAACLMPLGFDAAALWLMGLGVHWILAVAHTIAGFEGARGTVPSPDWQVLPLIASGFVLLVMWQGRARLIGLAPVAIGFAMWVTTERPAVLIADGGTLVGIMGQDGRALSKPKGAGFVALNWLENDGDPASQEDAAARWAHLGTAWKIRHVTGKTAVRGLTCVKGEVIVTNAEAPAGLPCTIYDPARLRDQGAVAFLAPDTDGNLKIKTARQVTGERLWNRR